jgi:hypothetical protein
VPFSFTFSPFFSSSFHIFSPKWHGLIFPPRGGGYFPIYRPLANTDMNMDMEHGHEWTRNMDTENGHGHLDIPNVKCNWVSLPLRN